LQTSTSRGLSPSILHEAVEAAIEQIASQTVASIVVEVTDDKSLPKAERKRCKSSRLVTRVAKQNWLSSLTSSKFLAISFSQRRIGRSNVDRVRRGAGVSPGLEWQFDDASIERGQFITNDLDCDLSILTASSKYCSR
jgi:hypothetical protein